MSRAPSPEQPVGLDEVVVVGARELDLASAPILEREVRRHFASGSRHVVIDLRPVGFVDSIALSALIGLRNLAKRTDRRLTLVPGTARVQRIFVITGTRGLFDWRDT